MSGAKENKNLMRRVTIDKEGEGAPRVRELPGRVPG